MKILLYNITHNNISHAYVFYIYRFRGYINIKTYNLEKKNIYYIILFFN